MNFGQSVTLSHLGQTMGAPKENTEKAAALYGGLAKALNAFFARHTSAYCSDCLRFHRETAPGDAIARHNLVSGFFPGCCQEGVAEDLRILCADGVRLGPALAEAIMARRPERSGRLAPEYDVLDEKTGKVHHGKGCVWLGACGCSLGEWKSPICLSYLCPPLIEALSANSGIILGEDMLGLSGVFKAIVEAAEGRETFAQAKNSLASFEERLAELEDALARQSSSTQQPSWTICRQ